MNRLFGAGMLMVFIGVFSSCSSGGYIAEVYKPGGDFNNTVRLKPSGNAEIREVNGNKVYIGGSYLDSRYPKEKRRRNYRYISMPPGVYQLKVGRFSVRRHPTRNQYSQILDSKAEFSLKFEAKAGTYVLGIIKFKILRKEKRWIPAIFKNNLNGQIVASPSKKLLGMTRPVALDYLEGRLLSKRLWVFYANLFKPKTPAGKAYRKGINFFKKKQYAQALRLFDKAISLNRKLAVAFVYKGITLNRLRQPAEALRAIDQGIRLARVTKKGRVWYWWPYYHRGVTLIGLKRVDQGIGALSASIALNPASKTYLMRGTAYFFRGNRTRKQVNPQAARGDWLRAKEDLNRVIQTSRKNSKVWVLKASVHLSLREMGAACIAIKKACEMGDCRLAREFTECNR